MMRSATANGALKEAEEAVEQENDEGHERQEHDEAPGSVEKMCVELRGPELPKAGEIEVIVDISRMTCSTN